MNIVIVKLLLLDLDKVNCYMVNGLIDDTNIKHAKSMHTMAHAIFFSSFCQAGRKVGKLYVVPV